MAMSGYQGNYIGLEETSTVSSQAPMVGRYYSDISQHTIQAVPAGRYYKVVDYYHEDLSSTGSDSSINRSTELFPSALKQLRKPSQASFTDDFIKKYYWNERFQLLLEKPVTNKEEGNRRHIEIAEHSQSLADNAMPIVKTIVDEVDLPFEGKTYKPIDAGGLAGGQKYIVDKMFVKFASDVYSLYGGDDNSAKAAGHELKGLSALISCNIPNLHFPLLCVINYKGYRVTVISRIPVDKNTIIYGSDDAGNTIHNRSYEIDKMLRHAAEILNLKVHKVKEHATGEVKEVPVPIDLEGHQGTDGRYYVVDFARLLPPETPFPTGTAAYLFRMLRPEFVRQYPRALSSDAFSPFDNNQQAKEATKFLHLKAIPQLAESLPSLLENPKNGCTKHLDDDDMAPLKRILHKYGINLRYLALLLHHVINILTDF